MVTFICCIFIFYNCKNRFETLISWLSDLFKELFFILSFFQDGRINCDSVEVLYDHIRIFEQCLTYVRLFSTLSTAAFPMVRVSECLQQFMNCFLQRYQIGLLIPYSISLTKDLSGCFSKGETQTRQAD